MQLLGAAFYILSAICTIVILIDAFQRAIWKGLVAFFCCLYFGYFALFEFEHKNKWLLVLGSFIGGGVGTLLNWAQLPFNR